MSNAKNSQWKSSQLFKQIHSSWVCAPSASTSHMDPSMGGQRQKKFFERVNFKWELEAVCKYWAYMRVHANRKHPQVTQVKLLIKSAQASGLWMSYGSGIMEKKAFMELINWR